MKKTAQSDRNRTLDIWGYRLPVDLLDARTREYLCALPEVRPPVQWVWQEMDRVWDEILLLPKVERDTRVFFQRYYSHPVWALNGVFTATDPESIGHRKAIAACVAALSPKHVVDYGGGFGALAQSLAVSLPSARIEILEPFVSALGRAKVEPFPNVSFATEFSDPCDVLIAQDVLEHVEQPANLVIRMAEAVKTGGHLIFANCFSPVIKCHLPETFYLRHTFGFVMGGLGLEFVGTVPGAPHAEIYRRPAMLRIDSYRVRNRAARAFGGALSVVEDALRVVWRRVRYR